MDDPGSPIGYLAVIILLILGGAYFAAMETALASVNRIRMMSLADNGDRRAKRVLNILDHFDSALTTILIGNNIMHIGCASVATLMATKLWGVSAVTLTTVIMTFVVFLVAETIPKRFAMEACDRLAPALSGSLVLLMKILTPLVFLFSSFSMLVKRPFHRNHAEEPTVSEEELHDIIDNISEDSAIDEDTTELVQNALDFAETDAKDIVTPWANVVTVPADADQSFVLSLIRKTTHSRLPVADSSGQIIGMLSIRKYLKATLTDDQPSVRKLMGQVQFVSGNTPIDDLLPEMSRLKTQTALVTDTKGAIIGLISTEDILEELVGEIYDEEESVKPGGADHE